MTAPNYRVGNFELIGINTEFKLQNQKKNLTQRRSYTSLTQAKL